jgi:hypothetical protein
MTTIADTVYPGLRTSPDEAELAWAFTPTSEEVAFAAGRTRRLGPRLTLLVMLKTFQRLGTFPRPAEVPPAIVAHIAAALGFEHQLELGLATVDAQASSYRSRLMALVRGHVGVAAYGPPARKVAAQAAIEASRGRDDLADIVNAAIEEQVASPLRAAGVRHTSEDRARRSVPGQPRLPPAGRRGDAGGDPRPPPGAARRA